VILALPRTFRALRHRNFRLFFIGHGLSVMGTWLQQVAMGWLTYRLSGSVWLLGAVAFCGNVGILAFGTFAGVIADHVHRRRALRVTQSLALFQALVLAEAHLVGERRRTRKGDRRTPPRRDDEADQPDAVRVMDPAGHDRRLRG
jgi:hypothetical protein